MYHRPRIGGLFAVRLLLRLTADLPAQAAHPSDDDRQWVMAAKNYANTRYSGLNQITADNAEALVPVWTFDVSVNRGQEAAPIVVGSMMYVVTRYPNIL